MDPLTQSNKNYTPLPTSILSPRHINFQAFRIETLLFAGFMFILIFVIVKFGNTKSGLKSTNNNRDFVFSKNIRASVGPISALSILPSKKSLFLKEIDGQRYQLNWSEGGLSTDLSDLSISKIVGDQETHIVDLDIRIDSQHSTDNFKIISTLGDSENVFITQAISSSLEPRQMLLNVKSGSIIDPSINIKSTNDTCTGYPFEKLPGNIGEKYLFICLDKDNGNEALYYYDLITKKKNTLISLNTKETFNCSPGMYKYGLDYLPVEPHSMEIAVCSSENHNVTKKVLVPIRYELISF